MDQADSKASIPKFGSFKPRSEASPRAATQRDHVQATSHHRSRSRERNRQSRPHHPQGRHRRRRRSSSSLNNGPEEVADELEESNLFIIDRRGDKKNIEFDSVHRYSVPEYHRTGSGSVIGATRRDKIDREESTEKAIVFRSRQHVASVKTSRRLLSSSSRQLKELGPLLRVVPSAKSSEKDDLNADSIPLHNSSALKRTRSSESVQAPADQPDFRSIEGKAKESTKPKDEDLEYASDSDLHQAQDDLLKFMRLKSAELLQKTKESPKSINAWCNLINHESNSVQPGVEVDSFTSRDRRTLAVLRISLYERALKHVNPSDSGHDRLLAGLLGEGALIWESSQLATQWDEHIKQNTGSLLLWKKYLDFLQTTSTGFSFAKCRDAYIQCLVALEKAFMQQVSGLEVGRMYIFLRMTCFLRDAGYAELAYSLWQVIFEYHFFRPDNVSFDRAVELEALEEWWEADAPRIGEKDAVGWDNFYAHGTKITRQSTVDNEHTGLETRTTSHALSAAFAFLPTTADDEETDDPFRFVMFSDMRDMLQSMFVGLSNEVVINGWLQFVGIPTLASMHTDRDCIAWSADIFVQPCLLSSNPTDREVTALTDRTLSPWCQRYTAYDLFLHGNFAAHSQDLATFVSRVIASIIPRLDDSEDLVERYLAYLVNTSMIQGEAKRVAKRLLKAKLDSLRLYNALALSEVRSGNIDKAIAVWRATLSGIPTSRLEDTAELWHGWLLTTIHHRGENHAVDVLNAMTTDDDEATNTDTRSPRSNGHADKLEWLMAQVNLMLEVRHYDQAIPLIECCAWLNYFLAGRSIEGNLGFYDKYTSVLESATPSSLALELLQQAKATMLIWHINQRRPYKPATLRASLRRSLQLFPENSLLIAARGKIASNLTAELGLDTREALEDMAIPRLLATRSSLPSRYHDVTQAICRVKAGSATRDYVRNFFITLLETPTSDVRHSPVLWERWIEFELATVEQNGAAQPKGSLRMVTQVFYNGARNLPWLKSWITHGLHNSSLLQEASEEEARKVLEVVGERGLRMGPEESIAPWQPL